MRFVRTVKREMGVIERMRVLWRWHRLWKNTDPTAAIRGCFDNKCEAVFSNPQYICGDCSWSSRVKDMLSQAGYREKYFVQVKSGFWHIIWERQADSLSTSGWLSESENILVIHDHPGR